MISVCMAAYNGGEYIREQLQSILEQTLQPDEVVICDDCSTDDTIPKIQDFLKKHGLQGRWRLYQNSENKGYPGNFYYAMSLCRGDIVFLSDQDDIWHPEKISRMAKVMEQEKEARVVACRHGLVDEEGAAIHSVMKPSQSRETASLGRITLKSVFYRYEWPGMTLAYRRAWFSEKAGSGILDSHVPHDLLLCCLAAEENGFLQLDEELAWHRRHAHNVGEEEYRLKKLLTKERKLHEIEKYNAMLEALYQEQRLSAPEAGRELQEKREAMHARYQALLSGKISRVIGSAWRHRRVVRLKTVVCDVLIVRQG